MGKITKEDNVVKNTATAHGVRWRNSHRRNGPESVLTHSSEKIYAYGTSDSYPGSCYQKSTRTTDNIAVRAGLDLQSEQRSYASWSMWHPLS